jgi:N-acetylglucosamine-6-sulfatase
MAATWSSAARTRLSAGVACDDGTACTTNDTCSAGVCAGTALSCDDGNACTSESCDTVLGCVSAPNSDPCDDGKACTSGDTCSAGACVGAALPDADADGRCDAVDNCAAVYNPSQADADADGVGDACAQTCLTIQRGVSGTVADTAVNGAKPGTTYGAATNLQSGTVSGSTIRTLVRFDLASVPLGAQVMSSTVTLTRTTSSLGTIDAKRVTAPWVEGTVTWQSFASAFDGAIHASFSNGAPATALALSFDLTSLTQDWVAGTYPNEGFVLSQTGGTTTAWSSSETPTFGVRPKLVLCYSIPEAATTCGAPGTDGNACDDGNGCTLGDACFGGVCSGALLSCDDGNACTADSCDAQTAACVNTVLVGSCNDGDACTTNDTCATGVCAGTPVVCDDGNGCTDDSCNSALGCTYAPNNAPCDDGVACTSGDACSGGACVGVGSGDGDLDSVCDQADNCVGAFNPSQADADGDGTGDACEQTCITVQRGTSGTVADAALNTAQPTTPLGSAALLPSGLAPGSGTGRAMFRFDLAAIPVGASIVSADATFYRSAASTQTVSLHRVTAPWVESTVTWSNFASAFDAVAWQQFASGSSVSATAFTLDLKTLVQAWASGTYPNNGFLFAQSTVSKTTWTSSEGASIGQRPMLQVCWVIPESAAPCALPSSNGTSCDDGDACTVGDVCGGGACAGTPMVCDDGNSCTTDSCLAGACSTVPAAGACDDGDSCTTSDTCQGGQCTGTAISCDDGNACTVDTCSPGAGCGHAPTSGACDDGNLCTTGDTCQSGACAGSPVVCSDSNGCTDDSCDPALGCTYVANAASCNDGIACTTGDVCAGGSCVGTPLGDADSDGICDPSDNCAAVYNPTQADANSDGVGDVCAQTCVTLRRGLAGTVQDTALVSTKPTTNYGVSTTVQTGTVLSNAIGQMLVSWDLSLVPAGAQILTANASLVATAQSAATINVHRVTNAWSEGTVTWGSFASSYASPAALSFSNGAPVTSQARTFSLAGLVQGWKDGIYPNNGVVLIQSGGTNTTWATSENSGAQLRPSLTVCYAFPESSGNCALPGTGGMPCSDGDACTTNDACVAGACVGTGQACDDGNPCTVDACSPATGCSTAPLDGTACSDGSACTQGDLCVQGACVPGAPIVCDDGNVCTSDSCVAATGCDFAANANVCDDGNSCTVSDACQAGACAGSALPDADTDGVCDQNDNCDLAANPWQEDLDGDAVGDACEPLCTSASEAQAVAAALDASLQCGLDRLALGPNAACPPISPPACADTLVADVTALVFGTAASPPAAADPVALSSQLACQVAISQAAADYVSSALAVLAQGGGVAAAQAVAAPLLDPIVTACAVNVAADAGSVVLPAVGPQCGAAVGIAGSVVDPGALRGCFDKLLSLWTTRVSPAKAPLRPNILLIVTDDQRWDTLDARHSVSGAADVMPQTTTRIADQGVLFREARTTTPLCSPSRTSILNGQYAHTHGVTHHSTTNAVFAFDDTQSIGVWLQAAGYYTGLIGKYLNGYAQLWSGNTPYMPPGWDDWYAFKLTDHYDYDLVEDGPVVHYGSTPSDYSTDVLHSKAQIVLQNALASGKPFFVTMNYYAPHEPQLPAPRHSGSFAGLSAYRPVNFNELDFSDKPSHLGGGGPISAAQIPLIDAYRLSQVEMVQAVDESIGGSVQYGITGMLDTLESAGVLDDTLVIFTSDHGVMWGEHRLVYKQFTYEEDLRIPLAVRYPRVAPLPRTDDNLLLNIDLAPTLLEVAGATPGIPVDGKSFLRVLDGTYPGAMRTEFVTEAWPTTQPGGSWASLRQDNWVYTEYFNGNVELYDLTTDPYQMQSVHANPAQAARLAAMAARLRVLRPAWPSDGF